MSAAKKGIPLSVEHRAKISAAGRGRAKTPEHIEKIRQARIGWALANAHPGTLPRSVTERRRHLKEKYGITEQDFDRMLEEQGGRCAICRSERHNSRNWHVDHDHATGRTRGLLCQPCNQLIGFAKESRETLFAAVAYLEQYS